MLFEIFTQIKIRTSNLKRDPTSQVSIKSLQKLPNPQQPQYKKKEQNKDTSTKKISKAKRITFLNKRHACFQVQKYQLQECFHLLKQYILITLLQYQLHPTFSNKSLFQTSNKLS